MKTFHHTFSFQNSIMNYVRRGRIQTRLIIAFLAMSMLPILLFGLYASHVYTTSVQAKVSEYASQSVTLLNKVLGLELEKYSTYIDMLSVSPEVQQLLSSAGLENRIELLKQKQGSLSTAGLNLREIQVINAEGSILYGAGYVPYADTAYKSLLQAIERSSTNDCLQYVSDGHVGGSLVLGRQLYQYAPSLNPNGYILLYFHSSLLHERIFSEIDLGPDSKVWIISADGTVLASNYQQQGQSIAEERMYSSLIESYQNGQTDFSVTVDDQKSLGVCSWNEKYNCFLIATIPYSYIQNETKQIATNLIYISVALLLGSLVAMLLIYASIVVPINQIVDYCRQTSTQENRIPIDDNNPDEIGFLARTIDSMLEQIHLMVTEQEKDQIRKRQLELEALQYQINPHFLFNTLNTLKWVASLNDVPVIYEGIDSLCALLQSTLLQNRDTLPLREELENLDHYFSIQRIRYGGSFDVNYEISENLIECSVPRFILQPLAENAIIHGSDDSGHIIQITVSAAQANGEVHLCVQDDGRGFNMKAMPNKKEQFSGIGIANVDERIRLYYGAEYGLEVQSTPGAGTLCRIHIPLNE